MVDQRSLISLPRNSNCLFQSLSSNDSGFYFSTDHYATLAMPATLMKMLKAYLYLESAVALVSRRNIMVLISDSHFLKESQRRSSQSTDGMLISFLCSHYYFGVMI